jgi:hypothetical protein
MLDTSIPEAVAPLAEHGPHLVENGWRVASRDGAELGFVIDASEDDLIVRSVGPDDDLRIPKRYIAEEAYGQLEASLVLDEKEARNLYVASPEA